MTVSAVIPTLNRRAYIHRAIDSILAQTVAVDEIIVVDDTRSTDNITEAIDSRYGSLVRVVKQGGGLSASRRRGVLEAKSEWIAFLDSDDEWTPDRNRELLEAAAAIVDANVAWIFGDLQVVTDEGATTTLFGEFGLSVTRSPEVFTDTLRVHYPFQFGMLQGSLIRRSALIELDCFSEGLSHSEDVLAGFQVACRYKFAAIPSVVGKYFRTSDLTSNSAMMEGLSGPDYFRARMLAFGLVVESGRRQPWIELHSTAVRDLCKSMATRGRVPLALAFQQFRYGRVSIKALAFFCAALLGSAGIRAWSAITELSRTTLKPRSATGKSGRGLQRSIRSLTE